MHIVQDEAERNLDYKALRIIGLLKYKLGYFLVLLAIESITSVSDVLNRDFILDKIWAEKLPLILSCILCRFKLILVLFAKTSVHFGPFILLFL